MAKYKTIGTVLKSKDFETTKETYIKVKEDVTLKAGQFINLVNPRTLPAKLEGKVSDEYLEKLKERAEKTPAFVMFDLQIKVDE